MKVVCAGCGVVLKSGPPEPVSHGLCRLCELESYARDGCLASEGELSELTVLREQDRRGRA